MTVTSDSSDRQSILRESLNSADSSVRFNAALDLAKQGDAASIPALIEALAHESPVVRLFHASPALVSLGQAALPALEAALQSPNSQVRVDAALTLYRLVPARLPQLLPVADAALLENWGPAVQDALSFIGEAGPAARGAVPVLLRMLREPRELQDPQAWFMDPRVIAAVLLTILAEPAEEIVPALADLLSADAPSARWGAAIALTLLGPVAHAATDDLIARVRDDHEFEMVRTEAAYALSTIADASMTVDVLLDLLARADPIAHTATRNWLRSFAARILADLFAPETELPGISNLGPVERAMYAPRKVQRCEDASRVVPVLAALLADASYDVRRNAAWALSQLGAKAESAIPALLAALCAEDSGPIAAEALAVISAAAHDAAISALTTLIQDGSELERKHAAYALIQMRNPQADAALAEVARKRPVDALAPIPAHFYLHNGVELDAQREEAFETLYQSTVARGAGASVDYILPYPKHEFLFYLVARKSLLLHGTVKGDLDVLKPLRWSTDAGESGNVSGVYADKDWIRPIYFGVVKRERSFGLANGFFDLSEDGSVNMEGSAGFERRYYKLAIGVNGLPRDPWQDATVYALPPATFEYWNEWTSRVPVQPVLRLRVTPSDLPLRDRVWGQDYRHGIGWVRPGDPHPFLRDTALLPIRPEGRPPWL
jgi:HEAT repeat protein